MKYDDTKTIPESVNESDDKPYQVRTNSVQDGATPLSLQDKSVKFLDNIE